MTNNASFTVESPETGARSQDEETVIVRSGTPSEAEEVRIHDYARMYSTPGLYEAVVQEMLECKSPETVTSMVVGEWQRLDRRPEDQRVLDVGAGNGVVGEKLASSGAGHLVGLDNIPEAEEAALRDRPGVYADYLTADLLNLSSEQRERLLGHGFNSLVCVGALGFGDIPAAAFANALNLVADGSVIGFTVNEKFLDEDQPDSFAGLIRGLSDRGVLEIARTERFRHRLSVAGEPLYYAAIVGQKTGPVPVPG